MSAPAMLTRLLRALVPAVVLGACGSSGSAATDGGAGGLADLARPPDLAPFDMAGPRRLSWTGLYADIATRTLAPDVIAYEPSFPLWTDGLVKRRWLRLPPGAKLDLSDPEHLRLPVGAQIWKEFADGDRPLETRLIERLAATGDDDDDFWVGAFLWLEDGSDAIFVEKGAADVLGTDHDVPRRLDCWRCHVGEPGRVLGISTRQLAGPGQGARLGDLAAAGLLTALPPIASGTPPGDATTRAALAYLHGNCGHCHNPRGNAWKDSDLDLRLRLADTEAADPTATPAYRSTVGVDLQYWRHAPFTKRVVPGDPDASAVMHRMSLRGTMDQMPTLGTERPDPDGVRAVRAWIEGLAP